MRKFKKISAVLSILLAFSISVGTFPLSALAQVYTGELQLPNTTAVRDYGQVAGGGQVPLNTFNNKYFPAPPTFTVRENNNFVTSLSQKTFSATLRDGVLNCTGTDINLNPQNGSIILIGTALEEGSDTYYEYPFLCQPTETLPTAQNTTINGNSLNGLGVVQTYDALPFTTLGESAQNIAVESIPNDPNKVRITINQNPTLEVYGLHFTRQGDVVRVFNGDASASYGDGALYKDGKTYVINWISNWIGQVSVVRTDGEGNSNTSWNGGVLSTSACDDTGCGWDPLKVNTGYPTPQISQIAATSPTVSRSVEHARDGSVIDQSVTQPECTTWQDGNFWRTVQHVHCVEYALSTDGRTGRADYYDSAASAGWFRELLGVSLIAVSLVTGGEFLTSLLNLTEFTAAGFSSLFTAEGIAGSVANTVASQAIAITTETVAAASGASAFGTVESTIASSPPDGTEKAWVWTWSELPAQPTVVDTSCPAGTTGIYPDCVTPICPAGTTGVYPNCTTPVNSACSTTRYSCSSGALGAQVEYPNASNPTTYAYQWWCNGTSSVLCTEWKQPTISVYREPKMLYQGQTQATHYETTNANSVSYSCTGADNPFLSRSDGPPTGPYLESSWNALWGTGWRGPYSCTWTAANQGKSATVLDNFNIMPAGAVPSLTQSVIVTVCSGNTPTWDPSTNSCKSATPDSFGTWSYPSCPTVCGTPASTQTQTCTGGNGLCSGTPASRSCGATAACSATSVTPPNGGTPSGGVTPGGGNPNDQGGGNPNNQGGQNQGNPSVAISAEPNRVRSGDTSIISWTLNNVNNCSITKNGTLWKSDISSSGNSTPEIITAQTTYTITCPSISPESVTVNILPIFQEF